MTTKCIQVGDDFSIEDDVLYEATLTWDAATGDCTVRDVPVLRVGDEIVLGVRENLRTGKRRHFWTHDLDGIGGNMNPNIKRTSGWRGTTNDVYTEALGIWRVTRMRELERPRGAIRIALTKIRD